MLTNNGMATTSDDPVTVWTTSTLDSHFGARDNRSLEVVNEGAAPGFYSVDGGNNWARLPAEAAVVKDNISISREVQIKRVSGGNNLSDVHLAVW